jgi:hypothetical protein
MNHRLHWTHGTRLQLGVPLTMILFPKKPFVGGSLELGFCLVRHSAISEQGVNFEEHCLGDCG